jgi:type IV secretory pathway VirB10-like protein
MARKLKTYTTSAGFFDLAVAAPSMKAALEAWGSKNNLFQHGFAKVSDDPKIVAATMARPGVVLRRPVGSNGTFGEHAKLPTDLPVTSTPRPAAKRPAQKKHEPPPKPVDDKAAREANRAFEKEQQRRDSERRKEEAARQKERERRERAVIAAEAALEEGRQEHEAKRGEIEKERAALDKRAQAEDARWRKKKDDLEADLRKARSGSHLRLV